MTTMLKRALAFKLNADSMRDLKQAGIPADVLAKLASLEGEPFPSRQALIERAAMVIGPASANRHARAISEAGRMLRPRRLARLATSVWTTYFPPSRLLHSPISYLLIRPFVFTARLRLRFWTFAMLRRMQGADVVAQSLNANVQGFLHNRKQMLSWLEGHRNRTESLMNILRTIQGFNPAAARVLTIGPRNEAEILLLRAYGFRAENIEAIDLFSYSPRIALMDMNDLAFPDGYFDVYYSSAVIKYSPDIRRSVAEAVRVTRDGGLMAFGFMFGMAGDLMPEGSALEGGVAELLGLFGGHVDHVYWQEEFRVASDDVRASVIFRSKN